MKKTTKLFAMLLVAAMVCGLFAVCGTSASGVVGMADGDVVLPREETLYFAGQQWGAVNSWNIVGTNQNNAMAIAGGAGGYRTTMFETCLLYTSPSPRDA